MLTALVVCWVLNACWPALLLASAQVGLLTWLIFLYESTGG